MIKRRLNCLPSKKNPEARQYHQLMLGAATLPPSADLRPFNPPIFDQGDQGSCHDDQTEVLTAAGWKLFSELTEADLLATVNPDTNKLIFERPTRVVAIDYSGPLHYGEHSHLDFAVTPDHKMLVRPWREDRRELSDQFKLVEAKDIGWYCGLMSKVVYKGKPTDPTYTIPGVEHGRLGHKNWAGGEDLIVPMESWLKFLGLYIAEGTMLRHNEHDHYKIQIAAVHPEVKQFFKKLCARSSYTTTRTE